MRLRGLFIFALLMLVIIGTGLPNFNQILETKAVIDADAEAGSAEEFLVIMRDSIRDVKDSIKIGIAKYDENIYNVDTAFKKILDENSELGFVTSCSATITTVRGKDSAVVELKLQYVYPRDEIIAMRNETDKKADEVIKAIVKPGMIDYEKVLAVHDFIVRSSRYDRLNAEVNIVPAEEHEAYGVLVKGIGVCDSYAKATKLLLEKLGVQCLLVEGSKFEGVGQLLGQVDHAWNIVRLDGEYYHIDTTWDDISEEKDSNELIYHHFNLNDEEMHKTHVWDESKYPECTGTRYNYYAYNRLIANNKSEAVSLLTTAVSGREKKLTMKLADYTSTAYNIEGMIKKAAEKGRPGQGISASWIINDSLGIIDIEFKY